MKLGKHIHILPLLLLALMLLCACSSRKNNTAKTRMYHSFFAKYNTFYNGDVSFKESKKMQINGHKDNYLEQLPLMVNSNASTNKIGTPGFDRAIEKSQKAIKNHSIKRKPKKPTGKKLSEKQKRFYAQKEFNPFLWRAWFMMADSYFAKGEFTEAASTYIYISRLYENDPKIVAKARIGLARCYNELDWLYESEDLLNRTKRDSLPTSLEKEYAHAKAGLLLKQKRNSEAAEQMKKAVRRKNTEKLDKAREYYLMGQLYKTIGNNKEAFRYFGKTISQNPPYELEFNARIRQTECLTNQSKKGILRKLNKMARSSKNNSYLSQIYYAIGNVHLNDKDTIEAVKAYEKGLTEGDGTGYGSGMLNLSLGKIYWEQEKFTKAKTNYEKAKQLLGEDTPEKEEITFRDNILQELMQYAEVIEEKNELLYWATLPQEQLLKIIDERIKEAKEKEKLQKKKERKEKRESAADNLASASTAAETTATTPEDAGKWYFYNPSIVSRGIRTFAKTWNNRELKDFWRLSNGVVFSTDSDSIANESAADSIPADSINSAAIPADSIDGNMEATDAVEPDSLPTDPTTREYYLSRIPDTEEKKQAAHDALRDALYEAGIVFKDKAGDKKMTLKNLEKVANNYPEFEKMPDTYYHLFLACSRWNEPEKADYYKALLMEQFPDNELTARIQQPTFFESAATRKHNEDSIYVKAYTHYRNMVYSAVENENSVAKERYPQGNHRARFLFIDAMAKLYSGKQEEAMESLKELVENHSADSISRIGGEISTGVEQGRLLRSGISLSIWDRKSDGTIKGDTDSVPTFSNERNEPYYFVLAFPNDSLDEKRLLFEMARYNFSRYMVRNFTMEFQELAQITMFQVKEFLNFDEAFVYRKRLYENGEMAKILEGINAYIISKSNLDLLLQYYSFADYERFYEETLMNIPELEIDGYTLDEPDYGDDEEESEGEENNESEENNEEAV